MRASAIEMAPPERSSTRPIIVPKRMTSPMLPKVLPKLVRIVGTMSAVGRRKTKPPIIAAPMRAMNGEILSFAVV